MAGPVFVGAAVAPFDVEQAAADATNVTGSLSVTSGHVLAVASASDGSDTTGTLTPTDSAGNAYTERGQRTIASRCSVDISSALAGTTASITGTVTRSITGDGAHFGSVLSAWSGSDGIGPNTLSASAQSGSITTTQDASAVLVVIGSWDATALTGQAWLAVNGSGPTEIASAVGTVAGRYTYLVAYYADVGAAGAKTVGLSTPTLGTPDILAIEIKGTAGPPPAPAPPPADRRARPARRRGRRTTLGPEFPLTAAHWFDADLVFPQAAGGGATVAAGTGNYTLTGIAAALRVQRTLAAAAGSYTLSGQAAALRTTRVMPAAAGTYSLAGQVVGLRAARAMAAASGTYVLSGQGAALEAGRVVVAGSGAYTLSGQVAGLSSTRAVVAGAGTYVLAGQAAALALQRVLPAAAGVYTLTGQAADLRLLGAPLAAAAGVYTLAWQAAALRRDGRLSGAAGTYVLSGSSVAFSRALLLAAQHGTYALDGQAGLLALLRRLGCAGGGYALTGFDADLRAAVGALTAQPGAYALSGQAAGLRADRTLVSEHGVYGLAGQGAALRKRVLSAFHRGLLEGLARCYGLVDPLVVTGLTDVDGSRTDGTLAQTLAAGVLTTTAAPAGGPDVDDGLEPDERDWLVALARRHGLLAPVSDDGALITDGVLRVQVQIAANVATYTRLP